ncbi:MAG: hypothetical protein GY835_17475 [bacterium]|nr:hypothetical protein [bacterium]
MTNRLLLAAALLLVALPCLGQEIYVQAQNHLEASHDIEVNEFADIAEDWLDLDLYGEGFRVGIRYSSFLPPDRAVTSTGESSEGVTHRFAELEFGDSRLRVGTFTKLFGRGLIFRSYENRDLRLDTNLDGFLLEHDGGWWQGCILNGRSAGGSMETAERTRQDRFSGADGSATKGPLTLGASFLTIVGTDGEDKPKPEYHALRAGLLLGDLQIDWEGARTLPMDGTDGGRGHILEASWGKGDFSFYGGLKRYRDLAVVSGDGALYNQPPVLIHDHRVTLLGRHPHQLDPNDEKGFLIDAAWSSDLGNFLTSYSETRHINGEMGSSDLRESFIEWDGFDMFGLESAHWIVDFKKAAVQNMFYEMDWDYYFTFAADAHWPLLGGTAVAIWEHQHKHSEEIGDFDDEFFSVEYQTQEGLTFSLIGEWLNWDRDQQIHEGQIEERTFWGGVQIATTLAERHSLRLFAGSRREGQICIGGVCRYEPAFDGVELTLISSF